MGTQGTVQITSLRDDIWLVELSGEHDIATSREVREAFDRVLDQGTRLIVDLTGTTFIDSSIIRTLLQARRRAESQDDPVIVIAPLNHQARNVLDLSGVTNALNVVATRDEAWA